ncbi:MAG: hypothetical protein NTV24_05165 [Candidatus Woesebacteria bacterium]|nr:hypothetical protein [Candidatus Woesebacteria bacterium]
MLKICLDNSLLKKTDRNPKEGVIKKINTIINELNRETIIFPLVGLRREPIC